MPLLPIFNGCISALDVERQLAEIDREVDKLSLKVVSLATLCDEAPKDIAVAEVLKEVSKIGLTDAVRSVLRANGDWMTAMQVRGRIVKLGVDLSKYPAILSLEITPVVNDKARPCVDTKLSSYQTPEFGIDSASSPTVWLLSPTPPITGQTSRSSVVGSDQRETQASSPTPAPSLNAVARARSCARNDTPDSSTY